MNDEEPTTTSTGTTYEVVGYDDVRAVAADAASRALDAAGSRSEMELQTVSESAANGAAQKVMDAEKQRLDDVTDDKLQTVADKSIEGVSKKLDEQISRVQQVTDKAIKSIDKRSAVTESTPVKLDETQYTELKSMISASITMQFVIVCVLALQVGQMLFSQMVKGWRK